MALLMLSRCSHARAWSHTHPLFTSLQVRPHLQLRSRLGSLNDAASMSSSSASPAPAAAAAPPPLVPAPVGSPADQPRPAIMPKLQSKFCRMCGGGMQLIQPDGDKEWRHVCTNVDCGYIDYFNPKMVVGCIVEHAGKILLCRRGIEPCKGMWTIPAGFMEIGESSAAGAARETLEEANARVQILGPYAHLDIPVIGQAYILFKAKLAAPYTFSAGPESLEVALFDPDSIPWSQIAFSSISITLQHYLSDMASGVWHVHHGVIHKVPGAAPNDPTAFELQDHFAVQVGAGSQ